MFSLFEKTPVMIHATQKSGYSNFLSSFFSLYILTHYRFLNEKDKKEKGFDKLLDCNDCGISLLLSDFSLRVRHDFHFLYSATKKREHFLIRIPFGSFCFFFYSAFGV